MSGDLIAAGLGAFAVSEATGTTNLTTIGSSSDDEENENPLSSIPGFAMGGGPPIDLSGLSIGGGPNDSGGGGFDPFGSFDQLTERVTETVQVPTGSGGGSGDTPGWQDLLGNLEQGTLYDPDRFDDYGSSGSDESGGSGGGSGGVDSPGSAALDAYNRITTPNDSFLGLNAGERTTNAVESGGETVGGLPMEFATGLFDGATAAGDAAGDGSRKWLQSVTGIEPQGTGINDDRPGIGVTDVITSVSKGTQDGRDESETTTLAELPGAVYEDVQGRLRGGSDDSSGFLDNFRPNRDGPLSLDSGGRSSSGSSGSSGSDDSGSSGSSGGSSGFVGRSPSPSSALGSDDPEDMDESDDEGSSSNAPSGFFSGGGGVA